MQGQDGNGGPPDPSQNDGEGPMSQGTTLEAFDLEPSQNEAAAGPGARAYLVVREGDRTQVLDLADGDAVTLGRSTEATVTLGDQRASREHARIGRDGGTLWVEDLSSRNGTRVGTEVLKGGRKQVASGDVVRIGSAEVVVAVAPGSGAGGAAPGGRLDRELARVAEAGGGRASLVRIAVDPARGARGLEALVGELGAMALVEEQRSGEYAALVPGGGEAALERLRGAAPEAEITLARFPADGKNAAALLARARQARPVRGAAAAASVPLDLPESVAIADPAMVKVFELARRVAAVPTTVLVLGETGVGKEVVVEQIHRWSPRANGPFVRLNCASLPESLLESELFGHEKGAFTGAHNRKIGYLEAAHGGTLFLDEIGELTLATQVKLLRVLETRRVLRVGGTQEIPIDVRLVSATHRDLEKEVAEGRFRGDLFFRLSAFSLAVPPLRERSAEIALLCDLFARQLARRMNRPAPGISPEAGALLRRHAWPGNVRELRNAIEHAVVLADEGILLPEHLPDTVRRGAAERVGTPAPAGSMPNRLAELERKSIEEALRAEGGNQTRAARRLGISRRALIYKLDKYGLKN